MISPLIVIWAGAFGISRYGGFMDFINHWSSVPYLLTFIYLLALSGLWMNNSAGKIRLL